jgi:hypothetical protein
VQQRIVEYKHAGDIIAPSVLEKPPGPRRLTAPTLLQPITGPDTSPPLGPAYVSAAPIGPLCAECGLELCERSAPDYLQLGLDCQMVWTGAEV